MVPEAVIKLVIVPVEIRAFDAIIFDVKRLVKYPVAAVSPPVVEALPVMFVLPKLEVPVTVSREMVVVANDVEPRTAKLSVEVAPVVVSDRNFVFSTQPLPFQ